MLVKFFIRITYSILSFKLVTGFSSFTTFSLSGKNAGKNGKSL